MNKIFNNKTILITGGTGSFGKSFINHLIKNYSFKKIIVYSRDEFKQFELQNKLNNENVRFFIGDVRDLSRLKLALREVDIVVHAAALKHVAAAEYNPIEAIKTNIIGAQNIIEACLDSKVSKVIALSTDKASSPINLYGATKLTSDKLFLSANNLKGNQKIAFSVVRYGNVFASRGSVVNIFIKAKKLNKPILITDLNMTRFNIELEDAIKFVSFALSKMKGGELFIPKMPSYRLKDLIDAIYPNARIKVIGIRAGEKLHESLISSEESRDTYEFDNYYIMLHNSPFFNNPSKINILKTSKKCKDNFSYNSLDNKNYLSVAELQHILNKSLIE